MRDPGAGRVGRSVASFSRQMKESEGNLLSDLVKNKANGSLLVEENKETIPG